MSREMRSSKISITLFGRELFNSFIFPFLPCLFNNLFLDITILHFPVYHCIDHNKYNNYHERHSDTKPYIYLCLAFLECPTKVNIPLGDTAVLTFLCTW